MELPFSQLLLFWRSQPFGIFTQVRRRLVYTSVRIGTVLLLFRGFTLPFRRGGVLPTNVDSDDMHFTGAAVFLKAACWGVITHLKGD